MDRGPWMFIVHKSSDETSHEIYVSYPQVSLHPVYPATHHWWVMYVDSVHFIVSFKLWPLGSPAVSRTCKL